MVASRSGRDRPEPEATIVAHAAERFQAQAGQHLACALYESYRAALTHHYDKVGSGGIIMFYEYGDAHWPGARKAIDEFFADKPEKARPHHKCFWNHVEKAS